MANLSSLFTPLLRSSHAPSTLYSSRRGDDSAGIRSSLSPLFYPFPLPLCSPPTPTSVSRPLTIVIPLPFSFSSARSSALSLSNSRRRSLTLLPSLPRAATLDALSLSTQTYHGEGAPGYLPSRSLAPFRDSFLPCPSTGASKGTIGRPG